MSQHHDEPSPALGAVSVEGAANLVSCQYLDFPSIETIDLDALNSRATTGRC
jgi:hypothetical protein